MKRTIHTYIHANKIRCIRFVMAALLLALAVITAACGAGTGSQDQEQAAPDMPPAERVLRAVTEYPTELSDSASGGSGGDEMQAWREAIGDCFGGDAFDTFYEYKYRAAFIAESRKLGLTTKVTGLSSEPADDGAEKITLTLEAADEGGSVKSYDTVWIVEYDKEHPDLLHSVRMLVDGGFFCRAGCELDIYSVDR